MENYFEMNMTKAQVDAISNLGLAHMGDCVYEILCRAILTTKAEFMAFQPFDVFLIPLAIFCGIAGFFIGIFGSLMSIRKFLKV